MRMAIATFKDLVIDTGASETLGRFYAAASGLTFEPDGEAGKIRGPDPHQTIWMNVVPEPKTVKQRVHLDFNVGSVDELTALGATVLEPAEEYRRHWTVLADPEGGELCAFTREPDKLADYRLFEMVIDCAQPRMVATWWAEVFGCTIDGREDKGWWWIEKIPGCPFESWDFVPVPEPKTVKNRIHWDVLVDDVADLVAAGAAVHPVQDDSDPWTVMTDPEGNEFCAFLRSR